MREVTTDAGTMQFTAFAAQSVLISAMAFALALF